MVVLDTCAIIELCKEKPSISTRVYHLIEKGVYILSISFAEIACKVRLGKLEMGLEVRELHREFLHAENITIVDIGIEEWFSSIELDWPENKDPVDRIITAYAMKKEFPIVSSDAKMKKFYNKVIW